MIMMTDDEIKAECEKRFQKGLSRTQAYWSPSSEHYQMFASFHSVPHAKRNAEKDMRIFARRKTTVDGIVKYVWKEVF